MICTLRLAVSLFLALTVTLVGLIIPSITLSISIDALNRVGVEYASIAVRSGAHHAEWYFNVSCESLIVLARNLRKNQHPNTTTGFAASISGRGMSLPSDDPSCATWQLPWWQVIGPLGLSPDRYDASFGLLTADLGLLWGTSFNDNHSLIGFYGFDPSKHNTNRSSAIANSSTFNNNRTTFDQREYFLRDTLQPIPADDTLLSESFAELALQNTKTYFDIVAAILPPQFVTSGAVSTTKPQTFPSILLWQQQYLIPIAIPMLNVSNHFLGFALLGIDLGSQQLLGQQPAYGTLYLINTASSSSGALIASSNHALSVVNYEFFPENSPLRGNCLPPGLSLGQPYDEAGNLRHACPKTVGSFDEDLRLKALEGRILVGKSSGSGMLSGVEPPPPWTGREVDEDGNAFFGAVRSINFNAEQSFIRPALAFVVSDTDIIGNTMVALFITVGVTIATILLALALGYVLVRIILSPLAGLGDRMRVAAVTATDRPRRRKQRTRYEGEPSGNKREQRDSSDDDDDDDADGGGKMTPTSYIREIYDLETSFAYLHAELKRLRSFMPDGLSMMREQGEGDADQEQQEQRHHHLTRAEAAALELDDQISISDDDLPDAIDLLQSLDSHHHLHHRDDERAQQQQQQRQASNNNTVVVSLAADWSDNEGDDDKNNDRGVGGNSSAMKKDGSSGEFQQQQQQHNTLSSGTTIVTDVEGDSLNTTTNGVLGVSSSSAGGGGGDNVSKNATVNSCRGSSVMRRLMQGHHHAVWPRVRVAVVHINLERFHDYVIPFGDSSTALMRAYDKIITVVTDATKRMRGIIDVFQGDHFVLSFNSSRAVTSPASRAALCAMQIVRGFDRTKEAILALSPSSGAATGNKNNNGRSTCSSALTADPRSSPPTAAPAPSAREKATAVVSSTSRMLSAAVGIASGLAFCGTSGSTTMKRHATIGPVYTQAACLSKLCKHFRKTIVASRRLQVQHGAAAATADTTTSSSSIAGGTLLFTQALFSEVAAEKVHICAEYLETVWLPCTRRPSPILVALPTSTSSSAPPSSAGLYLHPCVCPSVPKVMPATTGVAMNDDGGGAPTTTRSPPPHPPPLPSNSGLLLVERVMQIVTAIEEEEEGGRGSESGKRGGASHHAFPSAEESEREDIHIGGGGGGTHRGGGGTAGRAAAATAKLLSQLLLDTKLCQQQSQRRSSSSSHHHHHLQQQRSTTTSATAVHLLSDPLCGNHSTTTSCSTAATSGNASLVTAPTAASAPPLTTVVNVGGVGGSRRSSLHCEQQIGGQQQQPRALPRGHVHGVSSSSLRPTTLRLSTAPMQVRAVLELYERYLRGEALAVGMESYYQVAVSNQAPV